MTANCRARGRQLFGRGRQLFVSQRGERFETNVETETQLFSIAASRNNPTSYTFNADNYEASTKDASPMGKTDTATLLDKNGNVLAERNPAQLITNIKLPFPVWALLCWPSGCSLTAANWTELTYNDGRQWNVEKCVSSGKNQGKRRSWTMMNDCGKRPVSNS